MEISVFSGCCALKIAYGLPNDTAISFISEKTLFAFIDDIKKRATVNKKYGAGPDHNNRVLIAINEYQTDFIKILRTKLNGTKLKMRCLTKFKNPKTDRMVYLYMVYTP